MNCLIKQSKVLFSASDKDPNDPRFGNLVRSVGDISQIVPDIVFLGIPFDTGVKNSNGRIGASGAPNAIRSQILHYGTVTNIIRGSDLRALSIVDCGDVRVDPLDIFLTHARTTMVVEFLLSRARAVITLGGGHDLSYATVAGLARANEDVGGANIDAHFDVRPAVKGLISSGTPFWRLLERKIIAGNKFFEVGAQGHTNALAHYEYLKRHGVSVVFLPELRRRGVESVMVEFDEATARANALFVSVDIDAVAQAFAPGSSAPSPDGLFPKDVLEIAYFAGKNPRVRLFEIMEMNPLYDRDGRTARLAANIVLEFCYGFAERPSV